MIFLKQLTHPSSYSRYIFQIRSRNLRLGTKIPARLDASRAPQVLPLHDKVIASSWGVEGSGCEREMISVPFLIGSRLKNSPQKKAFPTTLGCIKPEGVRSAWLLSCKNKSRGVGKGKRVRPELRQLRNEITTPRTPKRVHLVMSLIHRKAPSSPISLLLKKRQS